MIAPSLLFHNFRFKNNITSFVMLEFVQPKLVMMHNVIAYITGNEDIQSKADLIMY